MKNKTHVSLNIYDYPGSAAELTARIKVIPDVVVDEESVGKRRRWSVSSGAAPEASPEDHIIALVEKFKARSEVLAEVARESKRVVISVGIDWHEFNPEMVFSPDILRAIGSFEAELWFDMYSYYEEEE